MNARSLRIAVVGGSIGGLTCGVLLQELGHDVHIYERSKSALTQRGAGIVVLPTTERYFTERRGDDDRVSLELAWWKYLDSRGNVLSTSLDRYRFSSWNHVYQALREAFPDERYHLASEAVTFDQSGSNIRLCFSDQREVQADLVVCADGVASTARSVFLPAAQPEYAGYVAWRGTVAESELSAAALAQLSDSMLYQVLDRSHILAYAIPGSDGSVEPGQRLQNFVWYRNYPQGPSIDDLMTDRRGERRRASVPPGFVRKQHVEELRDASTALAPTLQEIVLASAEPFIQAIVDLEVDQMVFGRVCIMGDAAFSARPHVAAGTAKAAADAWALRDALRDIPDIDLALDAWQERQLALGHHVVNRSRAMGQISQFENKMVVGDPSWKFGLFED